MTSRASHSDSIGLSSACAVVRSEAHVAVVEAHQPDGAASTQKVDHDRQERRKGMNGKAGYSILEVRGVTSPAAR